jgi:hypothetical protein
MRRKRQTGSASMPGWMNLIGLTKKSPTHSLTVKKKLKETLSQ